MQIIDFEISSGSALASSGRFLSFFKLPWFWSEKEKWLEVRAAILRITQHDKKRQDNTNNLGPLAGFYCVNVLWVHCWIHQFKPNETDDAGGNAWRCVCRCNVINLASILNLVTSLEINERAQETKMQMTAHVPFQVRLSVCQRNEFLLGLFSWLSRSITDPRKRRKTTKPLRLYVVVVREISFCVVYTLCFLLFLLKSQLTIKFVVI